MSICIMKSKNKRGGKAGQHCRNSSEGSSYAGGVSPVPGGTLGAFYSAGPVLGLVDQVQAKSVSNEPLSVGSSIQNRIQSLSGSGRPLSGALRNYFEPRFGHDFGNVRVHTGAAAQSAAGAVNARAFTRGNDVVFGPGQYSPGTSQGKLLLAHELTHVIQQENGTGTNDIIRRQPPHASNFIMAIFVDLTRQTVSWIYDNQMVSATYTCSTGAGLCGSDCSTPNVMNTACTPVGGPFRICSRRRHRRYRYFVGLNAGYNCRRGIGFHYYPKVDGCPWSHGCIRVRANVIDLIYQGARVGTTLVYISGTPHLRRCWTSASAGRCWKRDWNNPRRRTSGRCAWYDCWPVGDFPEPDPNVRIA